MLQSSCLLWVAMPATTVIDFSVYDSWDNVEPPPSIPCPELNNKMNGWMTIPDIIKQMKQYGFIPTFN